MTGVLAALLGSYKTVQVPAVPAMEFIETVNLTAIAASITFSSILQDYKHLQVRYVAKTSSTRNILWIRMNGVTTTTYASHQVQSGGTTINSLNLRAQTRIAITNAIAMGTSNIFSSGVIDIVDYKSTTNSKTISTLSGVMGGDAGNQNRINLTSGLSIGPVAITSLTFSPDLDSFAIGTRFSLYGIKG